MNLTQLHDMIQQDYIKVQKHPELSLYIYNYTAKAQYERVWNESTLLCRGLIMDVAYNVVARPFPKFFNLEETENEVIPNESFEVFEKMDGSLGILYWAGDVPKIATRGSFSSDQALEATKMLHAMYSEAISKLDKTKTYLFEIIYPENRIVIDYGQRQELVLLAVLDTATGQELPLEDIGFPLVKRYDGLNDLATLKAIEEANKEGFVVRFKNGHRLKVKFAEYQRIHRIVTNVSNVTIWEFLKEGKELNEILDRVPDEFYDWVRETKAALIQAFTQIEEEAKREFKILDSRKECALYYQTCQYPPVLFKMLENRDYGHIIWKLIRPKFSKPFVSDDL